MARLLMSLGRHDEAIAQERRAAELDPIAGRRAGFLAVTYFFARRFDDALRENELTRAADPDGRAFREFPAEVLLAAGRPKDALVELRRAFQAPPADDAALSIWGAVQAANGNRTEAERIYARLRADAKARYIPPRTLVILEIALGLKDAAFATLDRAIDENSDLAHLLKVHPLLDPLRSDPRFATALTRAGFR
jgi:tetratricopeptide (TPR) repeat protein